MDAESRRDNASSKDQAPLVSVIVVSFNREDDLRLSLEAIFASDYSNIEVIVVDNASADAAADVAATFPVRLIRNPDNRGFAEGNNQGLAVANGKYVALVNNDAIVARDWISGMVAFLERHPRAAAAGGRAYSWNERNPAGARTNEYVSYSVVDSSGDTPGMMNGPDGEREVATLSGAAVMIRRAAIDDVGAPFLDPYFFTYYEETDFFARALRKGWRLYYTGEPVCWHRVRASTSKVPYRFFYFMKRNRLVFIHRHFDEKGLALALAHFYRLLGAAFWARAKSFLFPLRDEHRAQLDVWKWYRENRPFLAENRVRYAGPRSDYQAHVRQAQRSWPE